MLDYYDLVNRINNEVKAKKEQLNITFNKEIIVKLKEFQSKNNITSLSPIVNEILVSWFEEQENH